MNNNTWPTTPNTVDTTNVVNMIKPKFSKTENKNESTESITFQSLMKKMEGEIKKALPSHVTPDRFIRIAISAYSRDEKLKECDGMTIIAACMEAAQLGLEMNTPLGHAYIIPYKNKRSGKTEAQFQIGYQGLLELCYRSGEYIQVSSYEVYSNDHFEYELGMEQKLIHRPAKSPEGDPVYYYAVYKRKDGGQGFYVMSRQQVEAHQYKYSKYGQIWEKDFNSMAKKTCIKKALKYAQKSIEVSRAFVADGSVKREISDNMLDILSSNDIEM